MPLELLLLLLAVTLLLLALNWLTVSRFLSSSVAASHILCYPSECASWSVDIPSEAFWPRRQGKLGQFSNRNYTTYIHQKTLRELGPTTPSLEHDATAGDEQRSKPLEANPRRTLSQPRLKNSSFSPQRPTWFLAGLLPHLFLWRIIILLPIRITTSLTFQWSLVTQKMKESMLLQRWLVSTSPKRSASTHHRESVVKLLIVQSFILEKICFKGRCPAGSIYSWWRWCCRQWWRWWW